MRAIRGGAVSATLLGGCLWLLMQTIGTPWEVELDGAILFFEDVKLPPYYLDGALTQLKHAGKLDRVVGVVVGEMKDCDWGDLRAGVRLGALAVARGRPGGASRAARRARSSTASRSATGSTWPPFRSAFGIRSTPTLAH